MSCNVEPRGHSDNIIGDALCSDQIIFYIGVYSIVGAEQWNFENCVKQFSDDHVGAGTGFVSFEESVGLIRRHQLDHFLVPSEIRRPNNRRK